MSEVNLKQARMKIDVASDQRSTIEVMEVCTIARQLADEVEQLRGKAGRLRTTLCQYAEMVLESQKSVSDEFKKLARETVEDSQEILEALE